MTREASCVQFFFFIIPVFPHICLWKYIENQPSLSKKYLKLLQIQTSLGKKFCIFNLDEPCSKFLQDKCLDSSKQLFGKNTMPACYYHTCPICMATNPCTTATQALASSVIRSRQSVSGHFPHGSTLTCNRSCLSVPVWDMLLGFSRHKNETCKTLPHKPQSARV